MNWTLEEKNKFFTLLMGKCWHRLEHIKTAKRTSSGKRYPFEYDKCIYCGKSNSNPDYYSDLSGFQIVKEYMEKEMNTVWEDYIWHVLDDGLLRLQDQVNQLLSLDNLLDYLLQNKEEWAYTEKRVCEYKDNCGGPCVELMTTVNMYCKDGIICEKHPALLFAEGKEER